MSTDSNKLTQKLCNLIFTRFPPTGRTEMMRFYILSHFTFKFEFTRLVVHPLRYWAVPCSLCGAQMSLCLGNQPASCKFPLIGFPLNADSESVWPRSKRFPDKSLRTLFHSHSSVQSQYSVRGSSPSCSLTLALSFLTLLDKSRATVVQLDPWNPL